MLAFVVRVAFRTNLRGGAWSVGYPPLGSTSLRVAVGSPGDQSQQGTREHIPGVGTNRRT
eukprot:1690429-Pyramimonas_sp.AAC.1